MHNGEAALRQPLRFNFKNLSCDKYGVVLANKRELGQIE
jgi:hypothetical protein